MRELRLARAAHHSDRDLDILADGARTVHGRRPQHAAIGSKVLRHGGLGDALAFKVAQQEERHRTELLGRDVHEALYAGRGSRLGDRRVRVAVDLFHELVGAEGADARHDGIGAFERRAQLSRLFDVRLEPLYICELRLELGGSTTAAHRCDAEALREAAAEDTRAHKARAAEDE
eukprot:7385683-Prymnesium_polylepis.2